MRHLSPDATVGLGSGVVGSMLDHSFGWDEQGRTTEEMYGDYLAENAAKVRGRLESLDDKQRITINRMFAAEPASPWVEKNLGLDEVPPLFQDFVGAMTKKTEKDEYAVGDIQLLNALEWHNHALAGMQAEMDARAPELKQELVDRFHRLVRQGWLPDSALGNLDRLQQTRLVLDDGFTSTVHNRLGYMHDTLDKGSGEYHVVFAPNEENNPATRLHELSHIVEGKDFVAVKDENGKSRIVTIGGVEQVFGDGLGGRSLREAVNEQQTDGMLHGRMGVLDPAARVRRHAVYKPERTLLFALAEKGLKKVDFRLFLAAQYEDGVEAERLGGRSAQATLGRALKAAFPFTNVVDEVSRLHTHEGENGDEVLLRYAHNLEARTYRHRSLATRIARQALAGGGLEYIPKHRADQSDEKSRGNSPAVIAARVREG